MSKINKSWENIIEEADKKYGKDSNIAKFWRDCKYKAESSKQQRFEELYLDRPLSFTKKDK